QWPCPASLPLGREEVENDQLLPPSLHRQLGPKTHHRGRPQYTLRPSGVSFRHSHDRRVGEFVMNWAYFALGVGALMSAVVVFGAIRRPGARAGIALAVPLLIVATMNAAAPVRGAIDPAYMGYIFGLLRARIGLEVTFIAGTLLLLCAVSAYLSATRRSGRP